MIIQYQGVRLFVYSDCLFSQPNGVHKTFKVAIGGISGVLWLEKVRWWSCREYLRHLLSSLVPDNEWAFSFSFSFLPLPVLDIAGFGNPHWLTGC